MASKYKPVVQNFIRTADKIYQLTYEDGTVIETTWSHPFYIEWANWKAAARSTNCEAVLQVFGWVKAEELRAGDVSKTDKGTLRIAKVHVDPRSEEVYNFEVAENHTYLVTDQGVVVHNATDYSIHIKNAPVAGASLEFFYKTPDGKRAASFDLSEATTDTEGNVIYTNDKGDRVIISKDGKKIVHEYGQGANRYQKELTVSEIEALDVDTNTIDISVDEQDSLGIWNPEKDGYDTMQPGAVVTMAPDGRFRVVSDNEINHANMVVHGIYNQPTDFLTTIQNTGAANRDVYGLYWGSEGDPSLGDLWHVTKSNASGNFPWNASAIRLANLIDQGKVDSMVCHSGGAALCMNSALYVHDYLDREALRQTKGLLIGPANYNLPPPGAMELEVVVNPFDPIGLLGSEPMIEEARRRGIFRRGRGTTHPFSDYQLDVNCFLEKTRGHLPSPECQ
ncbi:MAG: hypothetical protein KDK33_15275 [Leptospiraceae bacterium]|nr:hypothetical protein [Leptospiraceae bacterium]